MSIDNLFDEFQQGYYIGVMSGTSLDGMDVVLASFTDKVQLIATHSKDFDNDLQAVLFALCQPNGVAQLANKEMERFDKHDKVLMSELDWFGWASRVYGEFASEVVTELLGKANISADEVIAIGCHGQTVRHRPQHGFTLQLVDPNIIAERIGISVVTDFRRRDMAVAGQGAPLVPAFHQAMFTSAEQTRVLLNLGGIANITVLPASSDNDTNSINNNTNDTDNTVNYQNKVIGYDTGPANLLIDAWANEHLEQSYDANGDFARSGEVVQPLLEQLSEHPFFALPAPKSTGREDFHLAWLEEQLEHFAHHHPTVRYSPADVQATLTELTAVTVSQQVAQYNVNTPLEQASLYVCGGGAYNGYLLERLAYHLADWQVTTTDSLGLAPTWVEAVAFAWLARQSLMGEPSNLPAVTGASKPVVLGVMCMA